MDGLRLLERVRQRWGALPVLVLTGQGSKESVIECLRLRASDYIEKPVRSDELRQRLGDLVRDLPRASEPSAAVPDDLAAFVGTSNAAQQIRHLIEQVAPTTAGALIT